MNPTDGPFGETLTAMTAIKRYGKPEEVAELGNEDFIIYQS